jgi:hypothetical protein
MKNYHWYFLILAILMWNGMMIKRDQQMLKAYDACLQFTHHPDCPDSWKTKPAFSHR